MRVIGLGLAAIFAVVSGCQKEQPVSESAKKLSPAQEAPAAKLAAPSPEEPSVAIDVEDDETDDKGHGEPMDEVDDVSDTSGSREPTAEDPPPKSGEDPEE